MRCGTQPAAIGVPLRGATTNQLASTGPRTPKEKPRSSSGQRGSGRDRGSGCDEEEDKPAFQEITSTCE